MLTWTPGRQNTGYDKIALLNGPFGIKLDMYLLRYHEGSSIPEHTDPVEVGSHYRLNIILKHPTKGGEFLCENPIYNSKWVNFFRPDISKHEVTKVEEGKRYLFSIGWIWNS